MRKTGTNSAPKFSWKMGIYSKQLQELSLCFAASEAAMLLLAKRYSGGKFPFQILKDCVEANRHKTFSIRQFAQMLQLYPQTCRVSCGPQLSLIYVEPFHGARSCQLKYFEIQARREAFRTCIINHIESNFQAFLETGGIATDFDLEKHVKEIEPITLPGPNQRLELPTNLTEEPVVITSYRAPLAVVNDKCIGLPNNSNSNTVSTLLKRARPDAAGEDDEEMDENESNEVTGGISKAAEAQKDESCHEPKKRIRQHVGLPQFLLDRVTRNEALAKRLAPEMAMSRHKMQARQQLPAFLDLVYLYFRGARRSKSDFEALVNTIVERRVGGGNGGFSAIASKENKVQLVREQLEMLAQLVPEWCQISNSKFRQGAKIFQVNLSDQVDLKTLRDRTRLRSS